MGYDRLAEGDRNLWDELVGAMEDEGQGPEEITFVSLDGMEVPLDAFKRIARETTYTAGWGRPKVNPTLVVAMRDGTWYGRREYDGMEWFERRRAPERPGATMGSVRAKRRLLLIGEGRRR